MAFSKILGIIIIFTGLSISLWGIYQAYEVYSQRISPPVFFKPVSPLEKGISKLPTKNLEFQLQSMIQKQLGNLLPARYIADLLNFIVFSVLIGLFIFGGVQIAYVGVKLIKS